MIRSKDIHSGNRLLYKTEEGWEETTLDWQDIKWCEERPEDFNKWHKPIQINRDTLEKLLFSLDVKGLTWEVLKNAYVIYIGGFEFKITFPDSLLWINGGGGTHLKGLHHFQSIIYLLSRIEI